MHIELSLKLSKIVRSFCSPLFSIAFVSCYIPLNLNEIFGTIVVDPNQLCSDPDPGFHIHFYLHPALDPNRIQIDSFLNPDSTERYQISSNSKPLLNIF